jgi:hypothetical protein
MNRLVLALLLILTSAGIFTDGMIRGMSSPQQAENLTSPFRFGMMLLIASLFLGVPVLVVPLVTRLRSRRVQWGVIIVAILVDITAVTFATMSFPEFWPWRAPAVAIPLCLASVVLVGGKLDSKIPSYVHPTGFGRGLDLGVLGASLLFLSLLFASLLVRSRQAQSDVHLFSRIAGTWVCLENGVKNTFEIEKNGRVRSMNGNTLGIRGGLHDYDPKTSTIRLQSFHIDSQSESGVFPFQVDGDVIHTQLTWAAPCELHRIAP